MTTDCYEIQVPPVPDRPIDLDQPAYVLVDGRWVLLSEVIEGYLPTPPAPPAAMGNIVPLKTLTNSNGHLVPTASVLQPFGPTWNITAKAPNSRLLTIANFRLEIGNIEEPDVLATTSIQVRTLSAPIQYVENYSGQVEELRWGVGRSTVSVLTDLAPTETVTVGGLRTFSLRMYGQHDGGSATIYTPNIAAYEYIPE